MMTDQAERAAAAIPVAALRAVLGGLLDGVEAAGRLLADLGNPDCQHDVDERRRLKARLLAVLPAPASPGDIDDATADLLSVIPGDTCAVVTGWLSAPRPAGAGPGT
jgi:hypothetical protein